MTVTVHVGDCRTVLKTLLWSTGVQCCVTSPPYYGLRDYGVDGQIGHERTPDEYVAEMVAVFREVRRVLRDDGTLWLNIGDSYSSGGAGKRNDGNHRADGKPGGMSSKAVGITHIRKPSPGVKPKDLLGIPWMLAFALRADGWYLRSDIIWHKPNPMPESVTDRPTSAHEHVFLFSKSQKYYYDADAVREDYAPSSLSRYNYEFKNSESAKQASSPAVGAGNIKQNVLGRNVRNVWTMPTYAYPEAHFATFPPELPERCIKAGSKPGDMIFDPFLGAGTTALVADRMDRHAVGIELNPAYAAITDRRIRAAAGLWGGDVSVIK